MTAPEAIAAAPEGIYLRLTCCGRMLHLRHLNTVTVEGRPHVVAEDVVTAVQWHRVDCDI